MGEFVKAAEATFVMRGHKGKRVHAVIISNFNFLGRVSCSGTQAVGEDGAPQAIADMLDADRKIERIIVERAGGEAVIYSRIGRPQAASGPRRAAGGGKCAKAVVRENREGREESRLDFRPSRVPV